MLFCTHQLFTLSVNVGWILSVSTPIVMHHMNRRFPRRTINSTECGANLQVLRQTSSYSWEKHQSVPQLPYKDDMQICSFAGHQLFTLSVNVGWILSVSTPIVMHHMNRRFHTLMINSTECEANLQVSCQASSYSWEKHQSVPQLSYIDDMQICSFAGHQLFTLSVNVGWILSVSTPIVMHHMNRRFPYRKPYRGLR
jgi:hypothetical protein